MEVDVSFQASEWAKRGGPLPLCNFIFAWFLNFDLKILMCEAHVKMRK